MAVWLRKLIDIILNLEKKSNSDFKEEFQKPYISVEYGVLDITFIFYRDEGWGGGRISSMIEA